jgi:hypothetical protein
VRTPTDECCMKDLTTKYVTEDKSKDEVTEHKCAECGAYLLLGEHECGVICSSCYFKCIDAAERGLRD